MRSFFGSTESVLEAPSRNTQNSCSSFDMGMGARGRFTRNVQFDPTHKAECPATISCELQHAYDARDASMSCVDAADATDLPAALGCALRVHGSCAPPALHGSTTEMHRSRVRDSSGTTTMSLSVSRERGTFSSSSLSGMLRLHTTRRLLLRCQLVCMCETYFCLSSDLQLSQFLLPLPCTW